MKPVVTFVAAAVAFSLLAGCGNDNTGPNPVVSAMGAMAKQGIAKAKAGESGAKPADKTATPAERRAKLEEAGKPVLLVSSEVLGRTGFTTILDTKDDVITWKTPDGATFSQRNGVLIQTRGLGADLMSAQVPSVGQLLAPGSSYQRIYYFLGADDQGTRRTYDCTAAVVGKESIEVLGKLSNDYWIEGKTIRKSRQFASGLVGYLDFERVID
jgi:Group 4 capsule polysaccharide lipoprotein gfcB, YjbF